MRRIPSGLPDPRLPGGELPHRSAAGGWRYATGMAGLFRVARSLVMLGAFLVLTFFATLYVIVVGTVRRDTRHLDRVITTWSRFFLAVAPITYRVEGHEHIDPARQYVVVGNHLSNFDIPLLFLATSPLRVRFFAKKELYKIPLFAQAMDRLGTVRIDRQAGMSAHEAIDVGVAAARRRGFSLLVFPEGTRSRTGEMGQFKKGAFRIAVDNGLPILPVVIAGTFDANPPDRNVIRPATAIARFLAPIDTAGMTVRDDATPLMKKTRAEMETVYEEIRSRAGSHPSAQS